MAEPWIRVHANIAEKRVVIRASDSLRVTTNEAIGLLVRFWGAMSRLGHEGAVSGLTDREIETWAGWRGKRGVFAAFIRASHTDAEGRVNEWDEYAGALEDRRAKDRDRQRRRRDVRRMSRGQSAGSHADAPRDVTPGSAPARANETKRDDTRTTSSSSARDAFEQVVQRAASPEACRTALESMLSGNDPATPQPTRPVFERALIDYAMNGERWNALLFRAYLRKAASTEHPEQESPRPANGKRELGGARNDAAIDAWLEQGNESQPEVHHGE